MNDGPDRPYEPVWVLDDPRAGTSAQAIGIAERLGTGFRRIPLTWNWLAHVAGLPRGGSLLGLAVPMQRLAADGEMWSEPVAVAQRSEGAPRLVISSGSRSASVAIWLGKRFGCRLVHCMRPGVGGFMRWNAFDLLVIPEHDNPPQADNVMPVLGAPHRLSPLLLRTGEAAWRERLSHLPHPRVALLVGGPVSGAGMKPAQTHQLGRTVARMVAERGGAVLATTSRRTGSEATDALAAGLGRTLNLLYRWGEPGDNPYAGFLATADAIVVTADSVSMISEACATSAPVFVAMPELAGTRHRRLVASLVRARQVRVLDDDLSPWPRTPLDEAGRVAGEILRRFPLD